MSTPRMMNGAASPLSIFETSTTQHHRLGTRGAFDDRVFRYTRFSNATGVVSNNLCQSAIPEALHVSETGALSTPGVSSGGIPAGTKVFTALLGAAAAAANRYEDGYFSVQDASTGIGQMRKLTKHEAVGSAATGTFTTYDPFNIVIPTGSTWTLRPNPWADAIITPVTTITGILVGVPNVVVPAATEAAPTYCWLQTWGPCSVLLDASATVVGQSVIASATVGAVGVAVETDIKQRVGVATGTLTASAKYGIIFLQIAS